MGTTFVVNTNLTTINCSCGGTYAIQERYRQEKQEQGGSWRCPYCHTWWGYGKSEIDKLKAQLASAESTANWHKQRAEDANREAKHFRASRNAIKGIVTKIKRRVKHGVCPCCQRTFADLARHMTTKHPQFAEDSTP